jgi:hypothetical protein
MSLLKELSLELRVGLVSGQLLKLNSLLQVFRQ